MRKIIEDFAWEKGILAGACSGERLDLPGLEGDICNIPFFRGNYESRINPGLYLEGAKSVVVIGVGYQKSYGFEPDGENRGILSLGALGEDYHITLKRLLEELLERMKQEAGANFRGRIHVDSGPLLEREFGHKAGLGVYSRNRNLISKKWGSMFFIGLLVVNVEVESFYAESPEGFEPCKNCGECVHACPGGALDSGFDYRKCVSWLTQKKGMLTKEEEGRIGRRLYGCDECQRVCRWNRGKEGERVGDIESAMPRLADFLTMTPGEFKNRFGKTAIGWRGLDVMKRNAAAALENIERDMYNFGNKGDNR